MSINELVGEDGNIRPEIEAQAKELVIKIDEACKEYPPAITLFVLEAALTAEIKMYSPEIGDLFQTVMKEFKNEATLLIGMKALLKEKGITIKDLLQKEGIS